MRDHSIHKWQHEHVFLGDKHARQERLPPIKGMSHVTIEMNPCPEHAPISAAA